MDVLAVIPATAGDRPFAGQPSTLYTLQQARAARHVTHVIVLTADGELAAAAAALGCETMPPPTEASAAARIAAALAPQAARGFAPALVVLLDPAFPLRDTAVIDGAIDHLWRCGADSLVAVCPLGGALWVQDEGGAAHSLDGGAAQRRYVETAAIAGVRVGVFEQTGEMPTGRVVLWEVPATAALRLDGDADWQGAEAIARRRSASRSKARLRGIRLLVLDFDGVLTDNRVIVLEDGREAVLCSRGDGMGIGLLKAAGVPVAVISKEQNPVVAARCRKLDIPCLQGIDDKLAEFRQMIAAHGLDPADVAYMGNDVNDLECMAAAGVAIAPSDAHPQALRAAELVTTAPGGFGAVREVCDLLIEARAEPLDPRTPETA